MAASHGMFGSPVGEVAYADMKQTQSAAALALAQAAIAPAHGRLYDAQAARLEEDVSQERRLGQLAARVQPRGAAVPGEAAEAPSITSQLDDLAAQAMGAGLYTKALEIADKSAKIKASDARVGSANAVRARAVIDAQKGEADLLGRTFSGIKSQAELDEANKFYEFNTGRKSPYEGQMFSPGLIENINKNAMSVKDRAELMERELNRKNLKSYRDDRLNQLGKKNDLSKILADIARAREARLAKVGGGKAVTGPALAETRHARQLITKDFPALAGADLNEAAYTVASEARALRRANPALSADEALRRAYIKSSQSGDFVTSPGYFGTKYGREDKFQGGGKTPETPAMMPTDSKKLVKDRYYANDAGLVAQWNGKGFVVVSGGRPLSPHNGSLNEDPDDDDDDEEDDDE